MMFIRKLQTAGSTVQLYVNQSLMAGLIFTAAVCGMEMRGCQNPPTTAAQAAAQSAFTAELVNCVSHAKTLQESRLCRETVEAKWGISKDGG